ncbi:electron transfer flavoprotein beta subunit/FixA family protein [Propionibacterium freudenreichii]|uniref:electron transfer flavoprotein subunit beta/FixA family protein n=1 Tax=Propionibacterium freudenreichii TaxID=1744 RepID=UPI00243443C9|nr:electron transfer flavoprotein beta subunit/FixA family protein [Propionibacterium freudenreichii]WFF31134.1 electron transfer flavoprotein beta subunit/FixA family protein [Propionibacterium freudenreichii]
MTIVVAYKYAPNPQDAEVRGDGTVDWSRAKSAVSEYDPVAVQLGRELAGDAEVVGISVGGADVASSMAKKNAMSRGLDRGLVVADDAAADWNATRTASALAALVKKVDGADLLLTGDSSVDEGAKMMSALVAGYLGWPCFQEVSALEKTDNGYRVTQDQPGGRRVVEVTGPLVVAVAADAVKPKVPGMKDILAAGKNTVEVVPVADLEVSDAAIAITASEKPAAPARKQQILSGDDAAAQLVAALRADSVL